MKTISPLELEQWRTNGIEHQLIDVREPFEAQIASLGGELIPLGSLLAHVDQISRDKNVVVHCRSGKRSADAIRQLEDLGYDNLYNLEGGILAYSDEVDGTIPKY